MPKSFQNGLANRSFIQRLARDAVVGINGSPVDEITGTLEFSFFIGITLER
jgi:hypothetical protein